MRRLAANLRLVARCAEKLCDSQLDSALPNYATRQAAVLGGDAVALHEKLKQMLSSSASDDQMQAAAAFAGSMPSLQ